MTVTPAGICVKMHIARGLQSGLLGLVLAVSALGAGGTSPAEGVESFETIINVPGDTVPGVIGSNTQLNVHAGPIPRNTMVGSPDGSSVNIEVNFFGGSGQHGLQAFSGSRINVFDGFLGSSVRLHDGSRVTIDGGWVGENLLVLSGSVFELLDGLVRWSSTAGAGSTVSIRGGRVMDQFRADAGSTVTLSGGEIRDDFRALGAAVEITGGRIGEQFLAGEGARIAVVGGAIGRGFVAEAGAQVVFSGGVVAGGFRAETGSRVELVGGEFQLNGEPASGPVRWAPGDILTGVLADGSVFVLAGAAGDTFSPGVEASIGRDGTVSPAIPPALTLVPAGVADAGPARIVLPGQAAPRGLRSGQRLDLIGSMAQLGDHFAAVDATIFLAQDPEEVTAGSPLAGPRIGNGLEVSGSVVTNEGGWIGEHFVLVRASRLEQRSGGIGSGLVLDDSRAVIEGGAIGPGLTAAGASELILRGGALGGGVTAGAESSLTLHGGQLGRGVRVVAGGELSLFGSRFALDGQPVTGAVNLGPRSVLSGVLADGSPIVFSPLSGDTIAAGTLTVVDTPAAPPGQAVVTVPGDPVPTSIGPGQTLHLLPDGRLGSDVTALGATVFVEGGIIRSGFEAVDTHIELRSGFIGSGALFAGQSVVMVEGGSIGDGAQVVGPAALTVTGGAIEESLTVWDGASLEVDDGVVGPGLLVESGGTVLLRGGRLQTLEAIDADVLVQGGAIRPDGSSGTRPLIDLVNSRLRIEGGELHPKSKFGEDSAITMTGGRLLGQLTMDTRSTLTIYGGTIDAGVVVQRGSAVELHDGAINGALRIVRDSEFSVFGGSVGLGFTAQPGSRVTIRGGSFGTRFRAEQGSAVSLYGAEFELNGEPVSGSVQTSDLSGPWRFTGVLEDGSLILLSDAMFDLLGAGAVTLHATAIPPAAPVIHAPSDPVPRGLRTGQRLVLAGGAELGNQFRAMGAQIEVAGGTIGHGLGMIETDIMIKSGSIGDGLLLMPGSYLEMHGGTIGDDASVAGSAVWMTAGTIGEGLILEAGAGMVVQGGEIGPGMSTRPGTRLVVHDGEIGDRFVAWDNSEVLVAGGSFGTQFRASSGSEVTIQGGRFVEGFSASAGSEIHLLGHQFLLNGSPLSFLEPGERTTIGFRGRDVFLSGVLADGRSFIFNLNSSSVSFGRDFFHPNALVTVTLLPEPTTACVLGLGAAALARYRHRSR